MHNFFDGRDEIVCRMEDIAIIVVAIVAMIYALVKEFLRPGLVLFSVVVLLLASGVIAPSDALAGFANKGMVTVALLFLVSEGVRHSQCLMPIMNRIFPHTEVSLRRGYLQILPTIASISAFLNNTPIVVIFTPHIKAWCNRSGISIKKLLIPLSYTAILGGVCTLIGTSTNLVVHGLMIDAGLEGLTMFELGKVGVIIATVSIGYMVLFIGRILPDETLQKSSLGDQSELATSVPIWKRRLALGLLVVMIVGATIGSRQVFGRIESDMFLWAAVVATLMAIFGIYPAKNYTKYISWDILITIASALAISRAMRISGLADVAAAAIIGLCKSCSPRVILAIIYLTTNTITELITNNAAAAFAFPIALAAANQLDVSPTPFCVAIAIAASASFCSPIGYQTNTIVQALGDYSFSDFIRAGLPLTAIAFVVSMIFIPIFWKF